MLRPYGKARGKYTTSYQESSLMLLQWQKLPRLEFLYVRQSSCILGQHQFPLVALKERMFLLTKGTILLKN